MVRNSAFSLVRLLTMLHLAVLGLVSVDQAIANEAANSDLTYSLEDESEYSDSCSEARPVDWDQACTECCPLWSVKAGVVILKREQPRSIAILENTVTGDTILSGDDFNFNSAGGLDIALTREFGNGDGVEVRYFGVDGWSSEQTLTTPPVWNFPTTPPLFGLGVAGLDVVYTSRLYSTEINWRRPANDWLTVLAGFRWIEFHEQMRVGADFGGNEATVATDTANHLYGLQLGLDGRIWNYNNFNLDAYTKAGVYLNSADQDFTVTQAVGPAFGAGQRQDTAAFAGELGATGSYWFTDRLAFRAGYQLMWLESVAVASDQFSRIDVVNGTGIHVGGSAFFHGATGGLEYLW